MAESPHSTFRPPSGVKALCRVRLPVFAWRGGKGQSSTKDSRLVDVFVVAAVFLLFGPTWAQSLSSVSDFWRRSSPPPPAPFASCQSKTGDSLPAAQLPGTNLSLSSLLDVDTVLFFYRLFSCYIATEVGYLFLSFRWSGRSVVRST